LSLLPREKHFHHGDCHFYQGKNIFTMEIVTFTKGKTFSPRRLSLLPREKYFHHEDCHFYQGKNIFTMKIVTFTKDIVTMLSVDDKTNK
jgi:coenzyme F420-reducing hydrogenase delta subunit